MMVPHTAGYWWLDYHPVWNDALAILSNPYEASQVVKAGTRIVAEIRLDNDDDGPPSSALVAEMWANGRMLTAAPAMFAALLGVLPYLHLLPASQQSAVREALKHAVGGKENAQ